MQFIKWPGLLMALTTAAYGADVYTEFVDSNNNQVGSAHYDVANTNCFQVTGAVEIYFSQAGSTTNPSGPYCLTAYSDSNCGSEVDHQQFMGVHLDGSPYRLNDGLQEQSFWRWKPSKC